MGPGRLFLLFLVFAVLEIMVISAVAELIGWLLTLALVIATAMIGSALFRRQGFDNWTRLNRRLQAGEMPGEELVEGMLLLFGSVLLITPGFISDALGVLLLVPRSRRALAGWMIRKGKVSAFSSGAAFRPGGFRPQPGNVYDGEATVHGEPAARADPRKPRETLTLEGEARDEKPGR